MTKYIKKNLLYTIIFVSTTIIGTASCINAAPNTVRNTESNKAANTARNAKQIQHITNQIATLSDQLKGTPDTLIVNGYLKKDLLLAYRHSLELQRNALLHASPPPKPSLWQKFKNKLNFIYYYMFGKKKELEKKQNNQSQQAHAVRPQTSDVKQPEASQKTYSASQKTVPNASDNLNNKINTIQNPMGKASIQYRNKTIHIKQLRVAPQRDGISCGAHAMRAAQELYCYLTQPIPNAQFIAALRDTTQADAFVKQWMVGADMLLGSQLERIRDYFGFDKSQISVWDSPIMTSLSEILELNIDKSKPHVFVVNSASQSRHTNTGHWIAIAFDGNNQLIVTDSCNQSRLHHDQRVEAVIEFLCS